MLHDRLLRLPNRASKIGSFLSVEKLAVLETLGSASSGRGMSHRSVDTHYGHGGCVNALDWNIDDGRLLSGSDDTKLCIWKAGVAASVSLSDTPAPSVSSSRYGLVETIETGHTQNIFDVAWVPNDSNKVISVAGDKTIRLFDLNTASTTIKQATPAANWIHHSASSALVTKLSCHTSRVKQIITESSSLFLTCAEDGTIRQHDMRTSHSCSTNCGPPLIQYSGMKIYSMSISKARPHLLVLGGSSRYAYLHDRRMLKAQIRNDWNLEMEDGLTQCVRRFGVPNDARTGEIPNPIVSVALSDSTAQDLLVSYSDERVYLFHTDSTPISQSKRALSPSVNNRPSKLSRTDDEREAEAIAEEEEEELPNRFDEPELELATGLAALDSDGEELELEFEEGQTSSEEEDEEEDEEEEHEQESVVPLIYPKAAPFEGHLNSQTVKSVGWLGDRVVSGSDDGNVFIWTRDAKLVGIYAADSSIPNVYKPHPTLPILAISGIDSDIKIFGQSDDSTSNLIAEAESIIARNKEGNSSNLLMETDVLDLFRRLARDPAAVLPPGVRETLEEGDECRIM